MTPESWWQRRMDAAHQSMAATFRDGMGKLDRVEPRLAGALRDLLDRPGSLVRAVVAYLIGVECGMVEEAAGSLACGLEYLHTASLVVDDLPCMDDATRRRGAAALHVGHGEPIAILAALAMVNRGYHQIWRAIYQAPASRHAAASEWVDARLGTLGLIGGQAYDLQDWRGGQSAAEVSAVAARKTGDVLRLTVVLPALLAGAPRREIQLLDRLAMLRGLAYQAADDLKDVLTPDTESNKSSGRDAVLARPNLVMAEGLPAAVRRFDHLLDTGDRVETALPGGLERWGMLRLLRVARPASLAAHAGLASLAPVPAAI